VEQAQTHVRRQRLEGRPHVGRLPRAVEALLQQVQEQQQQQQEQAS